MQAGRPVLGLRRAASAEAGPGLVFGRENPPDPVYSADKIRAAVMLVHGKEGDRVPLAHAVRIRDALVDAGNSLEWLTERGEGHGLLDEANRAEAYAGILKFFAKHLTPGAGAQAGPP